MKTIARPNIRGTLQKTAKEIRNYCEKQKNLWRLVPSLALEADGRGGYSEDLQYTYWYGYWVINPFGAHALFVDCTTGKLCYGTEHIIDTPREASDASVLGLAEMLDDIDASLVIDELKEQAQEDGSRFGGNIKEQERWRHDIRTRLQLGAVYTNKHRVIAERESRRCPSCDQIFPKGTLHIQAFCEANRITAEAFFINADR